MSTKLGVDFLKQISNYITKSNSFDSVLRNLKITGGGNGKCLAELVVGKEHLNFQGSLNAGATATLIDNVTTYALMSMPCNPGVSVDLQVVYAESALEGDCLIIDANTVRAVNKLAYLECELRRKDDGALIAKGNQIKFVTIE